jgi:hypothetical protein
MKYTKAIDVITVTKNDFLNFKATHNSIKNYVEQNRIPINWLVIDGSDEFECEEFIGSLSPRRALSISYTREAEPGIYRAMNQGLAQVKSDFFIILNSGDLLLKDFKMDLDSLSESKVTCFESEWHDSQFVKLYQTSNNNVCIPLGKMPNHQAMVFPKNFASWIYDEKLKIAADQDLKFRLNCHGLLNIQYGYLVSSLTGGVSSRKLNLREAVARSKESWQVFHRNLSFPHAMVLWVAYSVRYFMRIKSPLL